MKITRNYITPFISLAFLVVGITGVLMMSINSRAYQKIIYPLTYAIRFVRNFMIKS